MQYIWFNNTYPAKLTFQNNARNKLSKIKFKKNCRQKAPEENLKNQCLFKQNLGLWTQRVNSVNKRKKTRWWAQSTTSMLQLVMLTYLKRIKFWIKLFQSLIKGLLLHPKTEICWSPEATSCFIFIVFIMPSAILTPL